MSKLIYTALSWYSYPDGYEKKQRMINEMTPSCRDAFWEACLVVRQNNWVETIQEKGKTGKSSPRTVLTESGRKEMNRLEKEEPSRASV